MIGLIILFAVLGGFLGHWLATLLKDRTIAEAQQLNKKINFVEYCIWRHNNRISQSK